MRSLKDGQRVVVTDKEHPMVGTAGTVKRRRMVDNGAWVDMDKVPPANLINFEKGDTRHKHILLYPDQCSPPAHEGSQS